MYYLSSSMSDRINFDQMARQVLEDGEFFKSGLFATDAETYFDLNTEFVDDVEEAEARIVSVAEEIIKERNAEGQFKLGRDWDAFEQAFKEESARLNVSKEDADLLLESAWNNTTDVDNITDYIKQELDFLRNS